MRQDMTGARAGEAARSIALARSTSRVLVGLAVVVGVIAVVAAVSLFWFTSSAQTPNPQWGYVLGTAATPLIEGAAAAALAAGFGVGLRLFACRLEMDLVRGTGGDAVDADVEPAIVEDYIDEP
jgi:hypothetical protein